MKNIRLMSYAVFSAGLLAAATPCNASTQTWADTDSGSPLDFLEEQWGSNSGFDLSYSGTWDITGAGYNPAIHGIDAITVWFAFADDSPGNFEGAETADGGDAPEYVDVTLGAGTTIWDNLEVDGRHPASTYTYYSMALNPLTHFGIFNDLKIDGKLAYTVTIQELLADTGSESLNREDTYLKVAKLEASFTPAPAPNRVPDGGSTLLTLGAAVLGLGGFRRFLIKA
jgi:hypothetical protein